MRLQASSFSIKCAKKFLKSVHVYNSDSRLK